MKTCLSETVKLIGEGKYNLNAVKEIKVTESFLGLTKKIRECQNEEEIYECTTRYYKKTLLNHCGCLPLSLQIAKSNHVNIISIILNL